MMHSAQNTNDDTVTHQTLSPQQQKAWNNTVSMLMWQAPGFHSILFSMLNAQANTPSEYVAVMSKDVPIAATDGKNIILNPDTFFEYNLHNRTFVVAHEVVHNVYGDVELLHRCSQMGVVPMNDGTSRQFNNDVLQRSMDARINPLLVDSGIGKPVKGCVLDPDIKGTDSVLDVYKKYYDAEFPDDDGGGKGQGNNPGGFDTLMKPGQATGSSTPRNQQQWAAQVAVAQTIEQARNQGAMAAGLKRLFQQILEPEVPWLDHIETLINRTVGDGGIDWTVPDPWLAVHEFFSPASTGRGAGWIVVWADTSGSRSDKELVSSIGELSGILSDVNPERLTVIWCDADIGRIDELSDASDLTKLEPVGGGGTDYKPVLDWITNQHDKPDLFIGFTDGYVDFPKRPHPFPTIWASSTDHTYPFGQVVRVNKMARI